MKHLLTLMVSVLFLSAVCAQSFTRKQLSEDYEYFCSTIKSDYCYFDKKTTNWDQAILIYRKELDTIGTRKSFVLLLERVFRELYDHHASLSTNYAESQKLVPTGADIWAAYKDVNPFIVEVRLNSAADRVGIRAGMELISFNDLPIEQAIQPFLPKTLKALTSEAKNFALQALLAGTHNGTRKITVMYQNKRLDFYPDFATSALPDSEWIESKRMKGNTGYIRINNRLGDNQLIPVFDSVLDVLMDTKALILDMRETPSGGNTTVARAILGRFIQKEGFYQKHELTMEGRTTGIKRSWVEIVSPRKKPYTRPLIILADHWTGSVGEAIVIGFDGLKRAVVIGTEMARLNGAVYSYQMPNTRIGFNFPAEKLFQLNGKPRESFEPTIPVNLNKQKPGTDEILTTAIRYINQVNKKSR